MAGLLAADEVPVLAHVLCDVLVADSGLFIADAERIERLVKPHVGHNGRHDLGAAEYSALLHVLCAYIEDVIPVDDIALLVNRKAAIRVAVKGKTDVKAVVENVFLQMLDMRGAAVNVDVQPVGVIVYDKGVRAESVKNALGHHPCASVGAVKTDLLALVGARRQRDEIADVAVAACGVIYSAADGVQRRIRQLLAAVQIRLDAVKHGVVHLLALAVEELDAVVVIGVMACRYHNTAVKIVRARNIRDAGCGRYVQQVRIRSGCGEPRAERRFEHIARTSGVLADDDLCLVILAVEPAEIAAYLECVLNGQVFIRFPAEAVCSEIFAHVFPPLFRAWRLRPCRDTR